MTKFEYLASSVVILFSLRCLIFISHKFKKKSTDLIFYGHTVLTLSLIFAASWQNKVCSPSETKCQIHLLNKNTQYKNLKRYEFFL